LLAEHCVTHPDKNTLIASAKILMVDDEHHARKTIHALLLAMGCSRILEARDGESGLDAIRTFAPDVVLLDWEAPRASAGPSSSSGCARVTLIRNAMCRSSC